MSREFNIPTTAILKIALVLLALWFVYLVRDIIALLFISLVLVAAIEPLVNRLEKRKIPRPLSVLVIYVILFFLVGVLISFLVPAIADQLQALSHQLALMGERLPATSNTLSEFFHSYNIDFNLQDFFRNISSSLVQSSGKIFSTTLGLFSRLFSVIVILSLTFYMSVRRDGIRKFFISITPAKHQAYVSSLIERVKFSISRWLRGQLITMAAIFVLYYVTLLLLGVPYALTLAILGGLFEIVPYLGPIISAIPAVIIGFTVSPLVGILVAVFYTIIQQFENHVITPQVMKKAVGLNPISVILALLIGGKLFGVIGVVLAVPAATAISVFLKDVMNHDYGLHSKEKTAGK